MAIYSYPTPRAPQYKKPTSVEECLPQARLFAKKEFGRAALGPVKRGDNILIVTYADQDKYIKEAVIQALEEEGAEKVDFLYTYELTGKDEITATAEESWREVESFKGGKTSQAYKADRSTGVNLGEAIRKYFDKHPEYTSLFWDTGGRPHIRHALQEHAHRFKNNWLFNNWEEFLSKAWAFPSEPWIEIERSVVQALGKASAVRITDPEGTHLEYPLTPEEAQRWQMAAWLPGHLFLCPLQATSAENSGAVVPISPDVPPVIPKYNGVLAGTANHFGFYPRIELYFEQGRLVEAKGGGRYGDGIRELMEAYRDIQWPGYPGKGLFWFCDAALCTVVKAFRRTSDLFATYWRSPNTPERNRAGIFHMGMGSRRHLSNHGQYAKDNHIPLGHIHVHNYFATFEIKVQGTDYWYKIIDKGWVTAMSDPRIRALTTQYGDPNELLSYDWQPPLPGINCEGDYLKDYAPDPLAYLKKRLKENKPI